MSRLSQLHQSYFDPQHPQPKKKWWIEGSTTSVARKPEGCLQTTTTKSGNPATTWWSLLWSIEVSDELLMRVYQLEDTADFRFKNGFLWWTFGGFLSHRGTPSDDPCRTMGSSHGNKPSSYFYVPPWLWKPGIWDSQVWRHQKVNRNPPLCFAVEACPQTAGVGVPESGSSWAMVADGLMVWRRVG